MARPALLLATTLLAVPSIGLAQDPAPSEVIQTAPPQVARLNPTGRDIPLTAPLREGRFLLGEIDFVLGADDSVRVGAARFVELVSPLLAENRREALQVAIGAKVQVTTEELAALEFPVAYDPQTISLVVQVPADGRPTRDIALSNLSDQDVGTFIAPAGFSAYINGRSAVTYVHQGDDTGFDDPLLLLDGAVRYRNVVFESEGSYQTGDDGGFTREGSRFVYDDRARTARWTAGDLLTTSRGFAGGAPIAGLSLVRSYSLLEPQRNIQPRGDRTFTVVRPSTVEAFINGRPVRQIRVDPGVYNFRDFPFTQGSNDVRLVVTDDAGGVETVNFSLFFDRTLLTPGLSEFALQVGVLTDFEDGQREYTSDPAAVGFYRLGINERLTLGANFNTQTDGSVVGGEALWASPIGTISADVAASNIDGLGAGAAFGLALQTLFRSDNGNDRSLGFNVQARSEDFSTPGDQGFVYPFQYEIGANYSQALDERQFVGVDLRHAKGRDFEPDENSARLLYGLQISSRANFTAEAFYEDRRDEQEYGIRASLTYRFGERSTGSADFDSRSERARVGYATSRGEGVGAWSASADVDIGRDDTGVNASFFQSRNRFDYSVNHVTSYEFDGGEISDNRTSLRAAGALVFADGKFAPSRPVFDSFAVVAPHRTLGGRDVYIEPREDTFRARSDLFGPAVVNNLSAFVNRTVTYDVPDAPAGYDLGAGAFRVQPPYRAGYLVTVGSDYFVSAVGRLVDRNGQPVSLLGGYAYEEAEPDRAPITVFTNRGGRFGGQGLRAGRWRIEMPGDPALVYRFTIPDDNEGIINLGELRPESAL